LLAKLRFETGAVMAVLLVISSPLVGQDAANRLNDEADRDPVSASSPRRIVSLVPVATEILFALGEGHRLVGRSRFDDYPTEASEIPNVGDAIRPSTEAVLVRRPDLVILIGGSDNARAAADLERLGVPHLTVLFNTFADLRRNILRLGQLVKRSDRARDLWGDIEQDLATVRELVAGRPVRSVYYDVGYPPSFTAGSGSYLDTLLTIAGGRNVFGDLAAPAPRVSLEAILARDPEVVIHPVSRDPAQNGIRPAGRPGWATLRAVPEGVRLVDADLVHRLGPRVAKAALELARAIHPEAFAAVTP
jgi:ABC-type Fe3+-hydroxamate transport system substrate-binding protein